MNESHLEALAAKQIAGRDAIGGAAVDRRDRLTVAAADPGQNDGAVRVRARAVHARRLAVIRQAHEPAPHMCDETSKAREDSAYDSSSPLSCTDTK